MTVKELILASRASFRVSRPHRLRQNPAETISETESESKGSNTKSSRNVPVAFKNESLRTPALEAILMLHHTTTEMPRSLPSGPGCRSV